MSLSYGFIETRGLVGSIEAADAMLKAAQVKLIAEREIGFGLVTIIIEGELGAVKAAVEAGEQAAKRVGHFVAAHVIPRPYDDTQNLILGSFTLPTKIESQKEQAVKDSGKNQQSKDKKTVAKAVVAKTVGIEGKILKYIKNNDGVSLNKIAAHVKDSTANMRVIIKKLIDSGKIEKVQQKYYHLQQEK